NSHVGAKYGIPFPVVVRAPYGVFGSNLPALMRAIVACGWFGIQTWIGGTAVNQAFSVLVPGWATFGGMVGGQTPGMWISFAIFWALNVYIIFRGMDTLRRFENWAGPAVLVFAGMLLVWMVIAAHGFGPILAQPSKFHDLGSFLPVFIPSMTGIMGLWATLSLNVPDFTRFAKNQRAQLIGQSIALPTTMTLFATMGAVITSASAVVFGKAEWDPVVLAGHFTIPIIVVIAMFNVALATLSVNIAANVVSPSYDFSNVLPKYIDLKLGGLITGILGIILQPWRLLADPSGFIFNWLLGYGGGMGTIAGVMIADYWLVRRRTMRVRDLYLENGEYTYTGGWNLRAVFATIVGLFFAWGGLVIPVMRPLYDYGWFVGFFAGLIVYWMVNTWNAPAEAPRLVSQAE
ncbi:MAG TPA: NCS1 family nucleobase:cation symporter-1, partial [Chloroflexota bacterium]|nr:NCS1 family nucleobase:cation symporter-1 [Chloroflexota bacterium]